jgi:hypothetical protein
MLESAYNDLENCISSINKNSHKESQVIKAITIAWQIIDISFRYINILSMIKGIKHKEPSYRRAEHFIEQIEVFRNYYQHLNTEINDLPLGISPIMGVVSWSTEEEQRTNTITIGTIIKGTVIDTQPYDTKDKRFINGVVFSILNQTISLSELYQVFEGANKYFNSWLLSNDYLGNEQNSPTFFTSQSLDINGTKRFVRFHIEVK